MFLNWWWDWVWSWDGGWRLFWGVLKWKFFVRRLLWWVGVWRLWFLGWELLSFCGIVSSFAFFSLSFIKYFDKPIQIIKYIHIKLHPNTLQSPLNLHKQIIFLFLHFPNNPIPLLQYIPSLPIPIPTANKQQL